MNMELTERQEDLLETISDFNMEARYGDYKYTFELKCTDEYTNIWIENISKDILEKLPTEENNRKEIMMKKKIGISVIFLLLLLLLQTKVNATSEINLVNKSNSNQYYWKNDTAYMEIETVTIDKEDYNIILLSTEFFENFFRTSYYDRSNQIFYFYGKNQSSSGYVKGNDNYYYESDTKFNLVQNCNIYTKVIDGRLYIPLMMYRQEFARNLNLGFDEDSNSLIFFGPTITTSDTSLPTIENVEIVEKLYHKAFYYNQNKYSNDSWYKTIDYLKSKKYGIVEYYSAIIDNKSYNIRVYYKYKDKEYVYDKYEIISNSFDGEIIEKIDSIGNFLKIKKNNKYGISDINGKILLEPIYDEITLVIDKDTLPMSIDSPTITGIYGKIIKLKRDDKYTLFSLNNNINILQDKWFDDIDTSAIIEIDAPSSVNGILGENKTLNMVCVYNNEKVGIVLEENVLTDSIYTKIEAIQISYTYMASDDAIDTVKTIIAYKLYKDDEIYILTNCETNENFESIGNYSISKNPYKNVNVMLEDNEYNVYGMIDNDNKEKLISLKKHKGYKRNYLNKENEKINYIWIISCVLVISIVFLMVLLKIKKVKKYNC